MASDGVRAVRAALLKLRARNRSKLETPSPSNVIGFEILLLVGPGRGRSGLRELPSIEIEFRDVVDCDGEMPRPESPRGRNRKDGRKEVAEAEAAFTGTMVAGFGASDSTGAKGYFRPRRNEKMTKPKPIAVDQNTGCEKLFKSFSCTKMAAWKKKKPSKQAASRYSVHIVQCFDKCFASVVSM